MGHVHYGTLRIFMCPHYISDSKWDARVEPRNTLWQPYVIVGLSLTFKSLAVSLRTTRFTIQELYMVFALRWVFCTNLRTDRTFVLDIMNL